MAVVTSPLFNVALISDLCSAEDKCYVSFTGLMTEWLCELTTEDNKGTVTFVSST